MTIYILNLFIILILGVLMLGIRPTSSKRRAYIIIVTLQLTLISGLRDWSVGTDTFTYAGLFEKVEYYSWDEILSNFAIVYTQGIDGLMRDPGYLVFEKTINTFTDNYQVFLIIIAMIFTFSLGYFTYRNSTDPIFTFLLYSCLFFSFFSITGHRQTLATALCLLGYEFIKKRKIVPFAILMAVAFTLHKSSLIFVIFYFLANKELTKKYIAAIVIGFPILMKFSSSLNNFLAGASGYSDYMKVQEGAGTSTFTLMLILIALVAFWRMKLVIKYNPQAKHYYNALLLSLVFTPVTWTNPSAMRIVQYFSIFLILLVPELIRSFKSDLRNGQLLAYYTAAGVLILLYLHSGGGAYYKFYWQ